MNPLQAKDTRHHEALNIATELVEDVRLLSKTFPEDEDMVMVPQIREAVMNFHKSVMMTAFTEDKDDFHYYTNEIFGKAAALDTLLQISFDLEYCDEQKHKVLLSKIDMVRELAEIPEKPKLKIVK